MANYLPRLELIPILESPCEMAKTISSICLTCKLLNYIRWKILFHNNKFKNLWLIPPLKKKLEIIFIQPIIVPHYSANAFVLDLHNSRFGANNNIVKNIV